MHMQKKENAPAVAIALGENIHGISNKLRHHAPLSVAKSILIEAGYHGMDIAIPLETQTPRHMVSREMILDLPSNGRWDRQTLLAAVSIAKSQEQGLPTSARVQGTTIDITAALAEGEDVAIRRLQSAARNMNPQRPFSQQAEERRRQQIDALLR